MSEMVEALGTDEDIAREIIRMVRRGYKLPPAGDSLDDRIVLHNLTETMPWLRLAGEFNRRRARRLTLTKGTPEG